MKFIQAYTLHFFLLGIMGMAYSMPVPMSKEDERIKATQDRKLGSLKEQNGNSNKSIIYRKPPKPNVIYTPSYDYIHRSKSAGSSSSSSEIDF